MLPIRGNVPTHSTPYLVYGLIAANCLLFLFKTWGPVESERFTLEYGFLPAELVSKSDDFEREYREGRQRELEREFKRQLAEKPIMISAGRVLINPRTGKPALFKDRPDLLEQALQQNRPGITAAAEIGATAAAAVPAWMNIFTCMFLHGGWMHLLGNMFFLFVFGANVEDRLGPWLFAAFYLGTGVCGNLAHTFADPGFTPLVGASGAIAGVMGAYVLLFPRTRILAIVPIGWYPATFNLPAWVYLIFYVVLQNLWPALRGGEGNVAYWAHIGGFAAGMAMIFVFPHRKRQPPPPEAYDPDADDADFVL